MSKRSQWLNRRNLLIALAVFQAVCLLNWVWIQPEPVELAFVIPQPEKQSWQAVSRSFEATHPGTHIKLISAPTITDTTDERAAIYRSDFNAEVAQHDLVYMDITWTSEFSRYLIDLMPLVEQDSLSLDGFLNSEVQAGEHQDGLYRMPMRADIGLLFYRKDLLDEINVPVPSTFAELLQVVQRLDQQISLGYLWQGRSYEGLVANFLEVLSTVGGTWIDSADKMPMLNDENAIEAVSLLQRLIQQQISPDKVTGYVEANSLEDFIQGDAVFLRGWSSFTPELLSSELGTKVGITRPFAFNHEVGKGCRGGWGFGIPQNTAHPEEAWEAVKYFTSAEVQKQFVLASGYLPSRAELFSDTDIVGKYPYMPSILDYVESAYVVRPALERYSEASGILQQAISKVLEGEDSVESAMRLAQERTLALFDDT